MERLFTVEFGPSRSKRFDKAVAEARRVARECTEVEPGRYRARFVLGTDSGRSLQGRISLDSPYR
jgi:hypothetical protein